MPALDTGSRQASENELRVSPKEQLLSPTVNFALIIILFKTISKILVAAQQLEVARGAEGDLLFDDAARGVAARERQREFAVLAVDLVDRLGQPDFLGDFVKQADLILVRGLQRRSGDADLAHGILARPRIEQQHRPPVHFGVREKGRLEHFALVPVVAASVAGGLAEEAIQDVLSSCRGTESVSSITLYKAIRTPYT